MYRGSFCFFLSAALLILFTCHAGFSEEIFIDNYAVSETAYRLFYRQTSDSLLQPVGTVVEDTSSISDSLRNMAGDSLLYYGRKVELDSSQVDSAVSRQVRRYSPKGAMWRSLLFPGWGQLYNGRYLKSIIIGGTEAAFIYGIYVQEKRRQDAKDIGYEDAEKFYLKDRKKFTWWLAGTIIYSTLDAYIDAQLMNFDISEDLSAGIAGGFLFIRVSF